MLRDKKIVLGVTGGIAVYKAAELVRRIANLGGKIQVIMTRGSQEFVTPLTFQTLSGNKVITEMFDLFEDSKIGHIATAEWADIFVVAPATANFIGKMSSGIADDFLSTTVMATKAPVLIVPAMNTNMYTNQIVQRNIDHLKSLGCHFVDPPTGDLACGTKGPGRLAEVDVIMEEIASITSKKDLQGEKILVTAGPTLEFLDPIRFITNRSTGKMGYAIARVAQRRGAQVTLISGPSILPVPHNIECLPVKTASEMMAAVLENFEDQTVIIKAAAVSDYTPVDVSSKKLKRETANRTLELRPTSDIISEIGKRRRGARIHIGFAAETDNLLQNAKTKLTNKNLDLIVANDVCMKGAGFGSDTNIVKILDREGHVEELPLMSKEEVAEKILDRVLKFRNEKSKTLHKAV